MDSNLLLILSACYFELLKCWDGSEVTAHVSYTIPRLLHGKGDTVTSWRSRSSQSFVRVGPPFSTVFCFSSGHLLIHLMGPKIGSN